jgi:hypothetical protein
LSCPRPSSPSPPPHSTLVWLGEVKTGVSLPPRCQHQSAFPPCAICFAWQNLYIDVDDDILDRALGGMMANESGAEDTDAPFFGSFLGQKLLLLLVCSSHRRKLHMSGESCTCRAKASVPLPPPLSVHICKTEGCDKLDFHFPAKHARAVVQRP